MNIKILSISIIVVALTSSMCNANSMTHYEKIDKMPVIGNFLLSKQESYGVNNSHYRKINKLPVIGGFLSMHSVEKTGKVDSTHISHYNKISTLPVIGK
ncbi:MAG: hypothetical protein KAR81_00675 [Sulfurimonas sp.]|nr:hypothetical protein [Sulfurimonas sp.]MCK4973739.1 hypothetical protein [Sulfurimonas sp.]